MILLDEQLPNAHPWLRLADPSWADPLDPTFAQRAGGRWNPPDSFPTLYLNEDLTTARLNLLWFVDGWPYAPEDLRNDTGPLLIVATLPSRQRVADVHTPPGVAAAGLPPTYPLRSDGSLVGHDVCQPVGGAAQAAGLRGVRCRSARAPHGAGRELAWFPASSRSRAGRSETRRFEEWFWA